MGLSVGGHSGVGSACAHVSTAVSTRMCTCMGTHTHRVEGAAPSLLPVTPFASVAFRDVQRLCEGNSQLLRGAPVFKKSLISGTQ